MNNLTSVKYQVIKKNNLIENLIVTTLGTIFCTLSIYAIGLFIEVCK